VGVVFMGLALTLVSFSCTVPFVGALLAAAAQGIWLRPLVGMLVFSATFALPFFVFALFPRALGRFPKSGAWMGVLGVTLGFVELAAAIKFLSAADLVWGLGLLTRPIAIALTAVLLGVAGLYLLGLVRLPGHEGQGIGPLRLVSAVGFLGAALYLVPGLWGAPLGLFDAYLPPRSATDFTLAGASTQAPDDDGWHVGLSGLAAARAEAAQTGRPVFVDFSGYTCTNCRYMEARVFTQPEVAARLRDRFVRVRVYTDDAAEGEALQRYQLRLTGTVALPTYAVLAPDGASLAGLESGTMPAARFAAFLDRTSAAFPVRMAVW
jgi:thiol:disulfide interchange protein